jgi:hypothetical protein
MNWDIHSWSIREIKARFRILVGVQVFLTTIATLHLFIPVSYIPQLPQTTADLYGQTANQGWLLVNLYPIVYLLLAYRFVSYLALLFFLKQGRSMLLICVVLELFYLLLSPPGSSGGIFAVVAALTYLLDGIVLLLSFFDPVREITDRNLDIPEILEAESN